MTDMGDVTFTLHVDGNRDERLRRLASGTLAITPRLRFTRVFYSLLGAVFIVLGVPMSFLEGTGPGIVLIAAGIFLIGWCGSRRAWVRRFAAVYGRSRFITEPTTYVLTPTGMRSSSDTGEGWWAWQRVAEVREHEDGLLVVFDGRFQLIDLPPSAFAAADRDSVARHAAQWIAVASADSPAGAS